MSNPFKAQYTFAVTMTNGVYTHAQVNANMSNDTNGTAIPQRQALTIDYAEIARIQAERDEMMIKNAPNAARQWGLI